ncbi:MAG: hypothetical protein ACLFWF_04555 [Alphaproteobacteria bacterium]
MTLRKLITSIGTPARLGLLALAGGLTLTACAYHGHPRHHGHGGVELELEYHDRDHDRRVCCKRGRRDWWTYSRDECHHDGGDVVSHRYCHDG